jgi:hypothetical protein
MTRFLIFAGAIGLIITLAVHGNALWPEPPLAFTDRWAPVLKRNEAACSWVHDCRPS